MAKKETQKDKKVKELLMQLASEDSKQVLKTIKSLKVHGNETVIEPLVHLWSTTNSETVKEEIVDLLNTIKSTKVPPQIVRCLGMSEYANARQILLASIWNSGLDYREFLGEIAAATVQGGFMDAMECITIIENIEGTLDEDQIMDALLEFKGYLTDAKAEDDSKNELIKEMVLTLQHMNDTI